MASGPRLPEINVTPSIETGTTGPTASARSFGHTGLQDLSHGIQDAGQAFYAVGINKKQKREKAEQLDSQRWVNDSTADLEKALTDFANSPENQNAEDYVERLEAHIKGLLDKTLEAAPNELAAEAFRERAQSRLSFRYNQAVERAASAKITGQVTSFQSRLEASLYTYRNEADRNFAVNSLVDTRGELFADLEESLGDTAPRLVEEMKSLIDKSLITATIDEHPEAAKTLLKESKFIDEAVRRSLTKQVLEATDAISLAEKGAFDRLREQAISDATVGQFPGKLPLEEYKLFYKDGRAEVEKAQDDLRIDALNWAHSTMEDLSSMNESSISERLQALEREAATPEQRFAFNNIILPSINSLVRQQQQDPAEWLISNNPEVKKLYSEYLAASDDEKPGRLTEVNTAILKYQGFPAPGAEHPERYLARPESSKNVMTMAEATRFANDINSGTPKEVIERIGQIMEKFPDEYHQQIAIKDLATLPKDGLRQEYQLLFLNRNAWWVDNFVGALSSSDDTKRIAPEAATEIQASVKAHPVWLSFQSSMIGDNWQRAKDLNGYSFGIETYARALMLNGYDLKTATDTAVTRLVSDSLAFGEVNGKPFSIARDRGKNLPPITDEEAQDLSRRLSLSLRYLDPREINQQPFTSVLSTLGADAPKNVERLQALRDIITTSAYWQMNPDGHTLSLYLDDDNGSKFQVTDRQGTPFTVNINKIPSFSRPTLRQGLAKEYPQETYDLKVLIPRKGAVENYPTTPSWIE